MWSDTIYMAIPLAATLCNLFLLLTLLTARQTKLVRAFIALVSACILWTGGSFLRRIMFYPGEVFWYLISVSGILLIPFLAYLFIYHFTNQNGTVLRNIFFGATVAMIVANMFGLFITNTRQFNPATGVLETTFSVTWAFFICAVVGIFMLVLIAVIITRTVRTGAMPLSAFAPFFAGICIMFVGVMLGALPGIGQIPVDTLGCMLNAVCLYCMLYKKRAFTLTQFASTYSTYLVSLILTVIVLTTSFGGINYIRGRFFETLSNDKWTMLVAICFSCASIIIFSLLNRMFNSLFVRGHLEKDSELKRFSAAINKTLNTSDIVAVFCDVLQRNVDAQSAYICIYNKKEECYNVLGSTDQLASRQMKIRKSSPLVTWLEANESAILYKDFKRTVNYKAMWEEEKAQFEKLQVNLILPIVSEHELTGLSLFSHKNKGRGYSYSEISFLESVATIAAISMKNAHLYETLQLEAQTDHLTGLLNRKSFIERFERDFETSKSCGISMVLISLDDFKLFNELYGNHEGDMMLRQFGRILSGIMGPYGVISRFSGKEFAISLPMRDSMMTKELTLAVKRDLDEYLSSSGANLRKFLTFSAGICSYPVAASGPSELITNTNMAVYSAKRNGKNKIVIYTREMPAENGPPDTGERAVITMQEYASTIFALTAAIDAKDHYTFSHSNAVSEYATVLAQAIGLDQEHIEIIRQAGLLHDIGKIGIPETILSKTTLLSPDEYETMKSHVELSIAIIRHIPALDYVIPSAISHHERWDGRGYPRGISGETIPIGGRVLAICDSFDAMVSRRPYKSSRSIDESLLEMEKNLGTQFDPIIGRAFIDLVRSGVINPQSSMLV